MDLLYKFLMLFHVYQFVLLNNIIKQYLKILYIALSSWSTVSLLFYILPIGKFLMLYNIYQNKYLLLPLQQKDMSIYIRGAFLKFVHSNIDYSTCLCVKWHTCYCCTV